MHSWDYFNHRWNLLQSADIARNSRDIASLSAELAELAQFLVYVTAKAVLGERLTEQDPVVRQFLKLGKDEDPRRALVELVGRMEDRHQPRIVPCPSCGAGVRDVRGVTRERCQFCGATVRTDD